jgi:hypothetical protein
MVDKQGSNSPPRENSEDEGVEDREDTQYGERYANIGYDV